MYAAIYTCVTLYIHICIYIYITRTINIHIYTHTVKNGTLYIYIYTICSYTHTYRPRAALQLRVVQLVLPMLVLAGGQRHEGKSCEERVGYDERKVRLAPILRKNKKKQRTWKQHGHGVYLYTTLQLNKRYISNFPLRKCLGHGCGESPLGGFAQFESKEGPLETKCGGNREQTGPRNVVPT